MNLDDSEPDCIDESANEEAAEPQVDDPSSDKDIKIRRSKYYFINKFFFGTANFFRVQNDKVMLLIDSEPGVRSESLDLEEVADLVLNKKFPFESSRHDERKLDQSFVTRELLEIEKSLFFLNILPERFLVRVGMVCFLVSVLTFDTFEYKEHLEGILQVVDRRHSSLHCYDNCLSALKNNNALDLRIKKFCQSHFKADADLIKEKLSLLTTNDVIQLDATNITQVNLAEWAMEVEKLTKNDQWTDDISLLDIQNLKDCVDSLTDLLGGIKLKDMKEKEKFDIRKRQRKILSDFFDGLKISKIMKEGGIVFSMHNLPSLLSYAIDLSNRSSEISGDNCTLLYCIDKIYELIDTGESLPLNAIKKQTEIKWTSLKRELEGVECGILDELMNKFMQSMTYEEAWSYALLIKGTLYEMLFAQEYQLKYVREHLKLSISEIIKVHFPDKLDEFISRSGKHVSLRDFKPDFYLTTKAAPIRLKPETLNLTRQATPEQSSSEHSSPILSIKDRRASVKTKLRISASSLETATHMSLQSTLDHIQRGVRKQPGQQMKHDIPKEIATGKDYLVLIEVGYQTDAKTKVEIDMNKYRPLKVILRELDIETIVITAADSSAELVECSWLSVEKSRIIKKWISSIFAKLSASMPVGVTDISIGDISTKFLRSKLASGHTRRSPVTNDDVCEYYRENKLDFLTRPSGVVLPKEIQKQFVSTLIYGSTLDKKSSDQVVDMLIRKADSIVDCVKKSNLVWEVTDSSSAYLYCIGMLTDFINSTHSINCSQLKSDCEDILADISELKQQNDKPSAKKTAQCNAVERKILILFQDLNRHNKVDGCICRTVKCDPKDSWSLKLLLCLKSVDPADGSQAKPKESKKREVSLLDRLCHITLSSRTGKQKDAKNSVISVLELIGSHLPGFLRDGKGTLIGTYGYILRKVGILKGGDITDSKSSKLESKMENIVKTKKTEQMAERKKEKINKNAKEFLTKLMNKLDKALSKYMNLTTECITILKELKEHVQNKLEVPLGSVSEFVMEELRPGSYIDSENLTACLTDLLHDCIQSDTLLSFFESIRAKQAKFQVLEDDRFPRLDQSLILNHLNQARTLNEWNSIGPDYSVIRDGIIQELIKRVGNGTISSRIIFCIDKFCHLMMHSELFKVLYIYSKICETYVNFTSEMSSPGIKIGRIKDLDLNLIVKVSRKKDTNNSCLLTNLKFEKYCDRFYLDRAKATMGQTLIYCELVTLFQATQTFGLFTELESCSIDSLLEGLKNAAPGTSTKFIKNIDSFFSNGFSGCDDNKMIRRLTENRVMNLIEVINCYTTVSSLITACNFINNSRKVSKLLQMYRYQFVISISEFCFPMGAGKKSCIPLRRVDVQILYIFILLCSFYNIKRYQENIHSIKIGMHEDATHMISLQLWPLSCTTIRQALSDIYICHIFNKEMNDFDDGSIRVMNEFLDRVFAWEEDVANTCQKYYKIQKRGKNGDPSKLKECLLRLRNLLCLKNTKTSYIDPSDVVDNKTKKPRLSEEIKGSSMSTSSSNVSNPDRQVVLSQKEGQITSKDVWWDRNYPELGTQRRATLSIRDSPFQSTTDGSGSWRVSASIWSFSDVDMSVKLRAEEEELDGGRLNTIMDQIKHICCSMKTYAYGCAEVCQAFTERAKVDYNPPNISRALKSSRNHEQISAISETTSILADSLLPFSLEASLQTITKKDAIKIGKTLNRRNRITADTSSKFRNFEKEISRLLLFPDEIQSREKETFDKMVADLRARGSMGWRDIMKISFDCVFRTENCSYIFSFIKSLNKFIRGKMKGVYLKLREECNELFDYTFGEDIRDLDDLLALRKKIDSFRATIVEHVLEAALECYPEKSLDLLTQEIIGLEQQLFEVYLLQSELDKLCLDKPEVSYPEKESELRERELRIFHLYSKELSVVSFLLIASQMVCTFSISSKSHGKISFLDYKSWLLSTDMRDKLRSEKGKRGEAIYNSVTEVAKTLCVSDWVCNMLTDKFNCLGGMHTKNMLAFVSLILANIRNPISSRMIDLTSTQGNFLNLKKQVEALYTRSSTKVIEFDLGVTITLIMKGSIQLGRRLLNRQEQGIQLPRSPRSKVIYEMIKLAKLQNTTSVQQMGFQIMKDKSHHFYAGLAPKAQIGGDRDLLVMERQTKVAIHCTEAASKSLMETAVRNDGLTNKSLKEEILSKAQIAIKNKDLIDQSRKVDAELVDWVTVEIISGDCTKWGPIHCPAVFSSIAQQLLKDNPDWSAAYMIIMLKSLNKKLEIPSAAIEKMLRSLTGSDQFRRLIERLKFEGDEEKKREAMVMCCDLLWKNNPTVQKLVRDFLSKGHRAFTAYNHMGQGIHHGTSSLHGNLCSGPIDELVISFIQRKLPGVTTTIDHAGSSDDFAKVITLRGNLQDRTAKLYDSIYKKVICDALNYMSGLMRTCQMMISEKSVASPVLAEFYSEFSVGDVVQPSTAKFINSQMINHSVTSPTSLYQACRVDAQQAMYMGVPLATITALCVFKQSLFISHSEEFYCKYEKIMVNSLPGTGRVYLPQYSNLLDINGTLEELNIIRGSIGNLITDTEWILQHEQGSESETLSGVMTESLHNARSKSAFTRDSTSSSDENFFSSDDRSPSVMDATQNSTSEISLADHDQTCLSLIMCKYYTNGDDLSISQGFIRLSDSKCTSLVGDPFLQLQPESVRTRIKQVKELKEELFSEEGGNNSKNYSLSDAAYSIISKSVNTEDYDIETNRLKQALDSRLIVWGLSGGIRNVSLPLHRQLLRSYLFSNNLPIKFRYTWLKSDESVYIREDGTTCKPTERIRYSDFLDCLKTICISPNLRMTFKKRDEITNLSDIPLELIQHKDGSTHLEYSPEGMREFSTFLNEVIEEVSDDRITNLQAYEAACDLEVVPTGPPRFFKTKLLNLSGKQSIKNDPAVIVAFMINQDSLYETLPTGIDFASLSSDVNCFRNNYVNISQMVDRARDEFSMGQKNVLELQQLIRTLLSVIRLVSKQSYSYTHLYVMSSGSYSDFSVDQNTVFQFCTIERHEIGIDPITSSRIHDTTTYDIIGAISVINWAGTNDNEKTALLLRLLRCNLKLIARHCEDQNSCCLHIRALSRRATTMQGGTCSSILHKESQKIRSKDRSKVFRILSKLTTNISGMAGLECDYEVETEIDYKGTKANAFFTFSSKEGSASGCVLNSTIYLTIHPGTTSVLESLELPLLKEMGYYSNQPDPYKLRQIFYKLLPLYSDVANKLEGKYLLVELNHDGTYSLSIHAAGLRRPTGRSRVIWVSSDSLTSRYSYKRLDRFEPKVRWTTNSLYIYLEREVWGGISSSSVELLLKAASNTLGKKQTDALAASVSGSQRRILLCRLSTQKRVSMNSLHIFHLITTHKTLITAVPKADTKIDSFETLITPATSIIEDTDYGEVKITPRTSDAIGSELEDKIKQLIRHKTITGLECIYPLFTLLKTFSISDIRLVYGGISDKRVGSVGNWDFVDLEDSIIENNIDLADDLSKLTQMRKVTSETFMLTMGCVEDPLINETIQKILQMYRNINSNQLCNISLVLSLGYLTYWHREVLAPSNPFTCIINRLLMARKVYNHLMNNNLTINLDMKSDSPKLTLIFSCPTNISIEEKKNYLVKAMRVYTNVITSWTNAKRETVWDTDGSKAIIHYSLLILLSRESILEELDIIFNRSCSSTAHASAIRSSLNSAYLLCTKGVDTCESLPDSLRSWIQEAGRILQDKSNSGHQERLSMEKFLSDIETLLGGVDTGEPGNPSDEGIELLNRLDALESPWDC
uniref:RNA-directed RNA polymerase L n=1 Tax=Crocidura tanakae nairovirus 2 TaxID=3139555 RepID=A0AB38ZK66_9VIRU